MVIAVVMLLVIGPEKLPKVARTFGAYAGRMQRFMAQVKDEVNRETRFEELQKLQEEVKSSVMQTQTSIMGHVSQLQADIASSQPPVESAAANSIAPTAAVHVSEATPIEASSNLLAQPPVTPKRRAPAKKARLDIDVEAATTAQVAVKKPRAVKPKSP